MYFMEALQNVYHNHGGLEKCFIAESNLIGDGIYKFREAFFGIEHLERTKKHVSNPLKGSSSKRLNMYLRWMVRSNEEGIDFGIWKSISPSDLMIPLDVHTSTVGRNLGLLKRRQNDWNAVEELTSSLGFFDPEDPVKYDYALFGLGVDKAASRHLG